MTLTTLPIAILIFSVILTNVHAQISDISSPTSENGDVFVGLDNGTVQWRRSDGTFVASLTVPGGGAITGMTFDKSGKLYVTKFDANNISVFAANGALLSPTFGSNYGKSPESIVFDISGNAYVGQAYGNKKILKFDSTGNYLANYTVTTEIKGSDWIDLAADQCTIYYTSEGQSIMKFDVCNNKQLDSFSSNLPGSKAFALRILPDGRVLVADSNNALLLGSSGKIIKYYNATGENNLFALNLDPDLKSFWTAGLHTGDVYKFNIDSGEGHLIFNAGTGVGGMAIRGEFTRATQPPPSIPLVVIAVASTTAVAAIGGTLVALNIPKPIPQPNIPLNATLTVRIDPPRIEIIGRRLG